MTPAGGAAPTGAALAAPTSAMRALVSHHHDEDARDDREGPNSDAAHGNNVLCKDPEVFPTDRSGRGVVSIFPLFEQEFPCFSPFGRPNRSDRRQAARNVNSRRANSGSREASLTFLAPDLSLMPDATGPILLVVGGDTKRLQWLTHHVTSHWPSAQVTTAPAADPASLAQFVQDRAPDAVILQIDFGNEAATSAGLNHLTQMLRAQPTSALYRTRRARQRAVGGPSTEMRREGLLAAGADHAATRCSRR